MNLTNPAHLTAHFPNLGTIYLRKMNIEWNDAFNF